MPNRPPRSTIQHAISSASPRMRRVSSQPAPPPSTPQTLAPLGADVEIPEPDQLPTHELYIDQALPQGVAILHVYQHGPEQYCIWGSAIKAQPLHTQPKTRPNLVLGKMVQDHNDREVQQPNTIRQLVGTFAFTNRHLLQWLNTLRDTFGNELNLIIADHTDFEIPWEMLKLSTTRHEYLGSVMTVSRWQQVIGDDLNEVFLEVQSQVGQGQVLAYIDTQEITETRQELEALDQLDAIHYTDIKQFQQHLQQDEVGFGLVYMACHGIFSSDIRHVALGSLKNKQQRLKLLDLRERELSLIKTSQSIIFLNACHSGRLQLDDTYTCQPHRMGFAELFISKGARGVISTLGGVGSRYAAELAIELLKELSATPEHSIAKLLTRMRARAVAELAAVPELDNEAHREILLRFIYRFMYVYYGNPMTVLQLAKRQG